MPIDIKLEGFDEMLADIEAAGGSIDKAVASATKQSAKIMQDQLKTSMRKAKVKNSLIDRMPNFEIKQTPYECTAIVGYKKTAYTPENISDYHKAIFLNYGTPSVKKEFQKVQIDGKWVTLTKGKGGTTALGFVKKAKTNAKRKIQNAQEEALRKILKRIER